MSSRIARRSAASVGETVTCVLMTWFLVRLVCLSASFEDGPRLEKRLDPERTEFTAHAGVFKSAERCLLIIKQTVDGYPADEDLRRYAAGALYVGPAHVG